MNAVVPRLTKFGGIPKPNATAINHIMTTSMNEVEAETSKGMGKFSCIGKMYNYTQTDNLNPHARV